MQCLEGVLFQDKAMAGYYYTSEIPTARPSSKNIWLWIYLLLSDQQQKRHAEGDDPLLLVCLSNLWSGRGTTVRRHSTQVHRAGWECWCQSSLCTEVLTSCWVVACAMWCNRRDKSKQQAWLNNMDRYFCFTGSKNKDVSSTMEMKVTKSWAGSSFWGGGRPCIWAGNSKPGSLAGILNSNYRPWWQWTWDLKLANQITSLQIYVKFSNLT